MPLPFLLTETAVRGEGRLEYPFPQNQTFVSPGGDYSPGAASVSVETVWSSVSDHPCLRVNPGGLQFVGEGSGGPELRE